MSCFYASVPMKVNGKTAALWERTGRACPSRPPDCGILLRKFTAGALSQLAHFGDQRVLCGWRKEPRGRVVEAAAFVTAFLEHAGGREVSKNVVAIGGRPELKRSDSLFHQRHIVHDHLSGQSHERQVAAELPDGHRGVVRRREFFTA